MAKNADMDNQAPAPYNPLIESRRVSAIRGMDKDAEVHLRRCAIFEAGQLISIFEDLLVEGKTDEDIWIEFYTMAKGWQRTNDDLKTSYEHLLQLARAKRVSRKNYDYSVEDESVFFIDGLGKHTAEKLLEKYCIFNIGQMIDIFEKQLKEKKTAKEIEEMHIRNITALLPHKIQDRHASKSYRFIMDKVKRKAEMMALTDGAENEELEIAEEGEGGPDAKKMKTVLFQEPCTDRERYLNTLECPICLEYRLSSTWVLRCDHHVCKSCYNALVYRQWKAPEDDRKPIKCVKCQAPVKKIPNPLAVPY